MGRLGDREKSKFTPSPYHLIALSIFLLARVARIAIDVRTSFLVAVDAPLHIVSIDHFDRSFLRACQAMADGTIYPLLNMDPVRKGDKRWKLIHAIPRDLSACFYISHNLQCLRPLADGIA